MGKFKYIILVNGRPEIFIPFIGAGLIETSAVATDNTCRTNTAINDFIKGRAETRNLNIIQENRSVDC